MIQTSVSQQKVQVINVNPDLNQINVKPLSQSINVNPEPHSINVKPSYATLIVFSDTILETFTYVDGGLYNQEGILISAGLYSTTSWDETWSSLV